MLKDNTAEMLEKLGFEINDGRITKKKIVKEAEEDYIYCGFNTYLSKDGRIFEKLGSEFIPVIYDEVDAELRFVERNFEL